MAFQVDIFCKRYASHVRQITKELINYDDSY